MFILRGSPFLRQFLCSKFLPWSFFLGPFLVVTRFGVPTLVFLSSSPSLRSPSLEVSGELSTKPAKKKSLVQVVLQESTQKKIYLVAD